uniref:Uncharacterized protein n=1 Tax=Setaria viridis TaxID=4556 RepID=A0A4U6UHY8_SETVI|nr:hypothetical protein SEVIR_6G097857v2 [Setaria viridis]
MHTWQLFSFSFFFLFSFLENLAGPLSSFNASNRNIDFSKMDRENNA